MHEQWKNLYAQSGWDLARVYAASNTYPEPLNTNLIAIIANSTSERLPISVPRLDKNRQIHFYLVASSDQQLEEAFCSLRAHLGNSYTNCDPQTYRSADDSFEKALLQLFPLGYKKISIYKSCSANDKPATYWVMGSVLKAIEQFQQRPLMISIVKRPIGVVLRHFFTAVRNGKGRDALRLHQELKNHQRLSPRNLLSLEIQALASGGQWRQVLRHPKLDDLVKGTIPRRLQNVLLDSVGYEINNSTSPADYKIERLSEQLQNLYPLFCTSPDLTDDQSRFDRWKLWAIGAVALGRTLAIEQLPDFIEDDWVRELKQWAGVVSSEPSLTQDGHTLSDYLRAEHTLDNAVKLLLQSVQSSFIENKKIYLKLKEYPVDLLASLSTVNPILPLHWRQLQDIYGDQLDINSWHDLFRFLAKHTTPDAVKKALTLAIDCAEYWTTDSWDDQTVNEVIQNISDDSAKEALRGLLPILMGWLEKTGKSLPTDAIEHLAILLVSDEQIAGEDLLLCTELLFMLVSLPHSADQYINLLDCITSCWSKVKSPRSVDSILDTFEILVDYPCADEDRRLQSWLFTQSSLVSFWSRLDDQQRQICLDIAFLIANDTSAFPNDQAPTYDESAQLVESLNGKKLAIYTLTEGAGRRAQKVLSGYFPGLDIQLNHDKTASDSLINLADTADYFIFSSRSAAHQAFYPVSKKRNDLIYPQGKGASSIIREFLNHVT